MLYQALSIYIYGVGYPILLYYGIALFDSILSRKGIEKQNDDSFFKIELI